MVYRAFDHSFITSNPNRLARDQKTWFATTDRMEAVTLDFRKSVKNQVASSAIQQNRSRKSYLAISFESSNRKMLKGVPIFLSPARLGSNDVLRAYPEALCPSFRSVRIQTLFLLRMAHHVSLRASRCLSNSFSISFPIFREPLAMATVALYTWSPARTEGSSNVQAQQLAFMTDRMWVFRVVDVLIYEKLIWHVDRKVAANDSKLCCHICDLVKSGLFGLLISDSWPERSWCKCFARDKTSLEDAPRHRISIITADDVTQYSDSYARKSCPSA